MRRREATLLTFRIISHNLRHVYPISISIPTLMQPQTPIRHSRRFADDFGILPRYFCGRVAVEKVEIEDTA